MIVLPWMAWLVTGFVMRSDMTQLAARLHASLPAHAYRPAQNRRNLCFNVLGDSHC